MATNDNTAIQLQLIAEIHDLLDVSKIPHWLDGGWALDFLVGEVTRDHDDIDWFLWKWDAPAVCACLEACDYQSLEVRHPDEHIAFQRHGQRISFTLNEMNEAGQAVTAGRWSDWPFPQGAFAAPVGQLGDIVCPIVSAAAQLDVKMNFHKHPAGGPLRQKDPADIERLRAYIAGSGVESY